MNYKGLIGSEGENGNEHRCENKPYIHSNEKHELMVGLDFSYLTPHPFLCSAKEKIYLF